MSVPKISSQTERKSKEEKRREEGREGKGREGKGRGGIGKKRWRNKKKEGEKVRRYGEMEEKMRWTRKSEKKK